MGYFLIILAIIISDQLTKKIIEHKLKINEQIELIKNRLYIKYVKNKGAAMGIMENKPKLLKTIVVLCLCSMAVIFIRLLKTPKNTGYKIGFSFVLGGGLGNFIDRTFKKEITDFIAIDYKKLPIFNIADIFIFIGSIIISIRAFFKD